MLYRPPVLCLFCADETSSAQWTICVPSLHLQTHCREEARKGRWVCVHHTHPQALLLPGRHRASLGGTGPAPLRFLPSIRLLDMKQEATDGFVRDTRGGCHSTQRFLYGLATSSPRCSRYIVTEQASSIYMDEFMRGFSDNTDVSIFYFTSRDKQGISV